MDLRGVLWLFWSVWMSAGLRILPGALKCSRQDIKCTARQSNCLDKGWLKSNPYTPNKPEDLRVSVDVRQDEKGDLHPVLSSSWTIHDDGSIRFLTATELHVLVTSTNQNMCVRYSLNETLTMRSPSGEKWSFSANMLVLDPGQSYYVSVFNIPKPELHHSSYDVSQRVSVPGCQDPKMKMTKFCIERGSLWQPNITLSRVTAAGGRAALVVSFSCDSLCEEYMVIVTCSSVQHKHQIYDANQGTVNASLSLDLWPKSCCQFDVSIKPLFPQCGQDCTRRRKTQNICETTVPTDAPDDPPYKLLAAGVGVVLMGVVITAVMCAICRKRGQPGVAPPVKPQPQPPLMQPPKVLVIYSQDHRLYRDIVLKLCAFLQAKCGTKVLVDLLDSTSVSMVGRLRWLEWQRQQLKSPSDKILVLCSQGVQAKWKAMCGQGQVRLREDELSPTGDMLTPFLNLFLPEMHQPAMLGKYMVAYFDDISSEQDIPSVFDLGVKYRLMKHFEELYFRILDIEKYQPGQVNHIQGIGADEYFNCPSGSDLRNAIETFQAYQLENPDWFEKECVVSEEELLNEANLLIEQLQIPPVLECIPLIRDGPPVYVHKVELGENSNSVHVLTPELNPETQLSSVTELIPLVNPEDRHQHSSGLREVSVDGLYPYSSIPESVYIAEPVLNKPPPPRQNWVSLEVEPLGQIPTEDEEEDSLLPMSQPSAHLDQRSSVLQNSLALNSLESSHTGIQREYCPSSEVSHSQPVQLEEDEELELKDPSSGSDQGYISRMSSLPEEPFKEDPLVALVRLQEELYQEDLRSEGNSSH